MRRLNHGFVQWGVCSAFLIATNACGDDVPTNGNTGVETSTKSTDSEGDSPSATGSTTSSDPSSENTGTNTDPDTTSSDTTATETGETGDTGSDTTSSTDPTTTSSTETGDDSSSSSDTTDDTTGDTDPPPDEATALKGLIRSMCGWSDRCCDAGEFDYIFGPFTTDVEDCTERVFQELNSNDNAKPSFYGKVDNLLHLLAYGIRLDRSSVMVDGIQACTEQWNTKDCNEVLPENPMCTKPSEDACTLNKLFQGRVTVGETCNAALAGADADIECESGTSCGDSVGNGIPADYQCLNRSKLNQSCQPNANDPSGGCEYGLYCDASSGRCIERPGVGSDCSYANPMDPDFGSEDIPCLEGLTCEPNSKKCVEPCESGSRCAFPGEGDDSIDENDVSASSDHVYCPESMTCVPQKWSGNDGEHHYFCRDVQSVGQACDTHDDCKVGFHCSDADPGKVGQCQIDIAADASGCGNDDEKCVSDHYCDSNTCKLWIAAGSNTPCDEHSDCNPNTSVGCVSVPGTGNRCLAENQESDDQCVPDWGKVGLPHPDMIQFPKPDSDAKLGVNDFSYLANFCETGICETLDSGQSEVCSAGVKEGAICDNDLDNSDRGTCEPGQHCINSRCEPLLASGSGCMAVSDDMTSQCHWAVQTDSDGARCHDAHGANYCGLVIPSRHRNYCDGT